MANKVSIDQNYRNADIQVKDSSNAVINPAKEDGNIQSFYQRFNDILGPMGQSWDQFTTNIVTLHHSHDYIHDGKRFIAHEYRSLANGSTWGYVMATSTKLTHFIPKINTNAEIIYKLIESPTVTSNGTQVAFYNRNRNSSGTTAALAYTGSLFTGGTEIELIILSSQKSFGNLRSEEEIDLKPSTNYVVSITANAPVSYSINLDIYET